MPTSRVHFFLEAINWKNCTGPTWASPYLDALSVITPHNYVFTKLPYICFNRLMYSPDSNFIYGMRRETRHRGNRMESTFLSFETLLIENKK